MDFDILGRRPPAEAGTPAPELQRWNSSSAARGDQVNTDRPMYRWRRMTAAQREAALTHRQENRLPWHGPPHFAGESGLYLITAACYEHRPHLALPPTRLADFEMELLNEVLSQSRKIFAWVILPNHYHLLVDAPDWPYSNAARYLAEVGRDEAER